MSEWKNAAKERPPLDVYVLTLCRNPWRDEWDSGIYKFLEHDGQLLAFGQNGIGGEVGSGEHLHWMPLPDFAINTGAAREVAADQTKASYPDTK